MSSATGTFVQAADFALEELEPRQETTWYFWYCENYFYSSYYGTWFMWCLYYWW